MRFSIPVACGYSVEKGENTLEVDARDVFLPLLRLLRILFLLLVVLVSDLHGTFQTRVFASK